MWYELINNVKVKGYKNGLGYELINNVKVKGYTKWMGI